MPTSPASSCWTASSPRRNGGAVRLLLDDFSQSAEMDWLLALAETHPTSRRGLQSFGGIRANPLNRPLQLVLGPRRLQRRMHNKSFIADNSAAIWGAQYRRRVLRGGQRLQLPRSRYPGRGPVAREVSAIFDDYWNCMLSVPLKAVVGHRPDGQTSERLAGTCISTGQP